MLPVDLRMGDFVTVVNKVQSGLTMGRAYEITSVGSVYFTIVDDDGYVRNFSDDYLNKNKRLYMFKCNRLDRIEKLKSLNIWTD